jgi:hypothetical protein
MAPTPPGPQASVCHPGASTGAFLTVFAASERGLHQLEGEAS